MRIFAAFLFVSVTGCAVDAAQSPTSSGGGDDGSNGLAHVDVHITDAPGDFESVYVTISRIDVSTADDSWVTLSDLPQRLDLLTLQNDATALLGGADLVAGSYGQLRLIVDAASVVVGGVEEPLEIASGAETGIKIDLDGDVVEGMTYALVLDYDAAKSVKSTGHGYLMTPVITVKSMTGTPTEPPDEPMM
jgi:hypothetical protein